MGIMGVLKWLRKDGNGGRHRWSMSPELSRLNNEACRIKAIRAFMDRRKSANDPVDLLTTSPDKAFKFETFIKKNNQKNSTKDDKSAIPGVPHVQSSEFFEIGWVAGTEDHYLEYIYAEWDNTKVSLKKHTHPDCENAIKADLSVLTEIRHPNILLLIATSYLEDYGLVSIFESLNCTVYNYIHEQGERISVQEVSRCARKLTEALGFAHMRGYVHSAINSHCVFLASGVIKLGGWELANKKDQPTHERDFEARLRSEIFRWQAPEIFCGQTPSEATDIYGLSLLIWEMTTMHLPWSGLSKPEVERQYLQWKRGVMIDLYNFPPLLSKLLEAGLQIDVTKRTMTMNRMRRFLQRLELQYETEAPIYLDQYTNNNINQHPKVFNVPVCTSPLAECHTTPLSSDNCKPAPKTLFNAQQNVCNRVTRSSSRKDLSEKEFIKTKSVVDKKNVAENKHTNLLLEGQRLHNEVNDNDVPCTFITTPEKRKEDTEVQKCQNQTPRVEEINSTSEERISSHTDDTDSTRTIESSEEDVFNDTRNDIKKLRESLANKRERFFYGDDLFHVSVHEASLEEKNAVLDRVRSKDYEPHKPASHKTSLEPKLNKSFQCDTMSIKPAIQQNQKLPYSCVSSEIREAVLYPQLLNANCQNFFESSLWRKEKLICISKMRKDYSEDNMYIVPHTLTPENSLSHQESLKTLETNETFTINGASDNKKIEENNTLQTEILPQDNRVPESQSLVALKEALDRATDIICLSGNAEDSRQSSPLRTFEDDCDVLAENMKAKEAIFEGLMASTIGNVDPNSEIKSIERSMGNEDRDTISQNTYKVNKRTPNAFNLSTSRKQCNSDAGSPVNDPEETCCEDNLTLLLFSDKNHDKACNSCHHIKALARRRSLPAALGQLKAYSKMSIGKLPIRRADLPDSTVEDIYIDDEFGDSLNVNMVLLENDTPIDEDVLPDLLELSHHSLYNG